ncbi:antitoxin Xre/MbcA/ParS toxin-binding domain-containing protein [Hydrogenophaga sp. ANAO-22]
MLDGDAPLQIAVTQAGAERVKDILTAIKYGGVL